MARAVAVASTSRFTSAKVFTRAKEARRTGDTRGGHQRLGAMLTVAHRHAGLRHNLGDILIMNTSKVKDSRSDPRQ